MDSSSQAFPPQKQDSQPGKEYLMHPRPQFQTKEYKPSNKLQGKVAIVTGGDSGIGRAVGHYFALEGATVAFTYVKEAEEIDAKETLEILKNAKTPDAKDPIAITADLGYEDECRRVVDEVVEAYGRIDVLVNNAAQQYERSIEEIEDKKLERLFRTNIFSHFFMSKYSLKYMKEGSAIINTSSVVAYMGHAELFDYSSTKGAIVAFTRSLSLQLADRKIRVNGVAPGPIWTPLIPASMTLEEITQFGLDTPMKRAGQPFEIAPCYVFLASDECSSYISGQVLHPNGGFIVNA